MVQLADFQCKVCCHSSAFVYSCQVTKCGWAALSQLHFRQSELIQIALSEKHVHLSSGKILEIWFKKVLTEGFEERK